MLPTAVYIESEGLHCAAGSSVEALWQSFLTGERALSGLDFPLPDPWPWSAALPVEAPTGEALGVDRKALRTMDEQARHALLAAQLAFGASESCSESLPSRIGLYVGLPTVDESVPPWSLLKALHEEGGQTLTTRICYQETPPFAGLSQLNSSACAHISNSLKISGPVAAFSPSTDAGLQALVEASLSVAESESEVALAGGVAPTLNPHRLLQLERSRHLSDPHHLPGEGAAFVVLSRKASGRTPVRVAGYARGFLPGEEASAFGSIVTQALARGGAQAAQVGWCLCASPCPAERSALQSLGLDPARCFDSGSFASGELGPADPFVQLLLALHGLRGGLRLERSGDAFIEIGELAPHSLLTARGPEGQYVVVHLVAEAL